MSRVVVLENRYAGQGPVLLDVGTDTGALVVTCPPALLGREIGIRRLDDAGPGPAHPPHVGVLERPVPSGRRVPSAVYPDLRPGDYRIWVLPDGPARTLHVPAGAVTWVDWQSPDG